MAEIVTAIGGNSDLQQQSQWRGQPDREAARPASKTVPKPPQHATFAELVGAVAELTVLNSGFDVVEQHEHSREILRKLAERVGWVEWQSRQLVAVMKAKKTFEECIDCGA